MYMYMYMSICICVCVCVYMYMYMYMYICMCIYVYVYMYMYTAFSWPFHYFSRAFHIMNVYVFQNNLAFSAESCSSTQNALVTSPDTKAMFNLARCENADFVSVRAAVAKRL